LGKRTAVSSCVSAARPAAGMSFAYGGTGDEWAEAATFHSLGRPIDSMTS